MGDLCAVKCFEWSKRLEKWCINAVHLPFTLHKTNNYNKLQVAVLYSGLLTFKSGEGGISGSLLMQFSLEDY